MTVVSTRSPSTARVTRFGQRFPYQPDRGYEGSDSFSYHAESVNGSSSWSRRRSRRAPTPTPIADLPAIPFKVKPGGTRQLTLTFCVDADGDALVGGDEPPEHGSVAHGAAPGRSRTRPATRYVGPDPFAVTVDDGHGGIEEVTVERHGQNGELRAELLRPRTRSPAVVAIAASCPSPASTRTTTRSRYVIVDEPDNGR